MNENHTGNPADIVMETKNVTKVYPGTVALKNVDFKLYRGKVNVLIGQNGAGKSTLMRLLAGIEQPTEGDIYLNGQLAKLCGPRDATAKGIAIIHQELNLFPELNVLQNIFMGQENIMARGLLLNNKRNREDAARILKKLEHFVDLRTRVGDLRMGQQQIIEIAKTMVQQNMEVLIMDEPTSSLSKAEVEILFKLIGELKQQGITIVYISHRMEEILRVGDYVTAFRDGCKVAEAWVRDIDLSWMVHAMVGRTQENLRIEKTKVRIGEEILRVDHARLPSESGGYVLDDVSFQLRAGEVLGVYGLMGAGRTELLETLMGMHPEAEIQMYMAGKPAPPKSIRQQVRRGLFLVPEDRKDVGLVHSLSVGKNLTIASLEKHARFGCLQKKSEEAAADGAVQKLSIKVSDKKLPIFSLSGGNQQKVAIGKGVLTAPRVLLLDEPTRGIDVAAKEEVFKLIFDFAQQGFGVIVVASELGEILRVADRILVLSGGKIAGEFSAEEATEERLVKASEEHLVINDAS